MRALPLIGLCLLASCSGARLTNVTPDAGLDVARAALNSGDPDAALRLASDRLRASPDDVAALLLQGDADAKLQRPEGAEAAYRRVLSLQPGSIPAMIGLGRLDLVSDPAAAELLFLQAISKDPRNAIALNDLGIARDLQGHHEPAQAAYRQALGVAPDMQAAMVNLAMSLALSGQAGQARDLLRPLAASPDASARVRHDFAMVSELAGDRSAAEKVLGRDMVAPDVNDALKVFDELAPPAK